MNDTTTAPRWIDAAEVAKMIRRHLKVTHPGVTFSVRTSRYAGGSSISVRWTDGPTSGAVDETVRPFSGSGFDGQIDLQYGLRSWYCPKHGARVAEVYGHGAGYDGPVDSRCCHRAELVHFGGDYVFTTRTLSPEFRAELAAQVAREYGRDYDPTVMVDGQWMDTLLYRLSAQTAR